MNSQRSSSTRDHLERLQVQFPATEELGPSPVLLGKNIDNAFALAHSMRLATFDYPLAFGNGYRTHDVRRAAHYFRSYDVDTSAVGEGKRILGGVAVARHIAHGWDMDPTDDYATITHLFRFRGIKPEGVQNVGRVLLGFALGRLTETDVIGVRLSATVGNTHARSLYAEVGFDCTPGGYTHNGSHKLVSMTLNGKSAIEEAHNIIQAQL